MLINEVCTLTGLTKKAISYYEEQGLIKPKKDKNGYREYSAEHVILLNEISLYRKLDIPIKDIKTILKSKNKACVINKIIEHKQKQEIKIKMQKMYLERIISEGFNEEVVKAFNEELVESEKNQGEFIRKELIRAFPSGIGKYLAYHFAPYLNEPLDTVEKYTAWTKIIEFLDNVPEIKLPKIIEMAYDNMTDEMLQGLNDNMRNEVENMFNAKGEELEVYKKKILDSIEMQNDKSLLKVMNPFYKFKKQLNEFYKTSGYYDVFLPNIKIISSSYREYHEKLTKVNDMLTKELGIKYDENMRIIKV